MSKVIKQCPHLNTVQHGGDKEIRTYCTDCNECIKVVKFGGGQTGGVGMTFIGTTKLK